LQTPNQHKKLPIIKTIYAEYEVGRDGAYEIAQSQNKALKSKIEKIENQPKTVANIKAVRELKERKAAYDKYISEYNTELCTKREAEYKERYDTEVQKRAEQKDANRNLRMEEARAQATNITDLWNKAPKVDGFESEIMLSNGETLKGKYILTEDGAFAASHNKLFELCSNNPQNNRYTGKNTSYGYFQRRGLWFCNQRGRCLY